MNPLVIRQCLPTKVLAIPASDGMFYRPGTLADLPFMDQMQKLHAGKLGFQYWQTYEQAVGRPGSVWIAHDASGCPMGFIFGKDRYASQDQVGIVFQLAVVPMRFRGKVGANLLRHFVDHAAYGMRLLCCYCAQDLQANYFWEAMGFLPIAFRTGSRRAERIHIFWQRRVRSGDTQTPFWFPSMTTGGAIREDRIVLPIPPHVHWKDAKPVVLPQPVGLPAVQANGLPAPGSPKMLGGTVQKTQPSYRERMLGAAAKSKHLRGSLPGHFRLKTAGGIRHVPVSETAEGAAAAKPVKPKVIRPKVSQDHRDQARELRDRFLEEVNAYGLLESGKYDVSRVLAGPVDGVQFTRLQRRGESEVSEPLPTLVVLPNPDAGYVGDSIHGNGEPAA